MLPQPDVDPQVAAAISKVRNRTARQAIRDQWFHGVELVRFEYTTEARHALIADVAVDPRLVDRVGGRRPDCLSAVIGDYARVLIGEAARGASPLRQSAAKALLGDHPLPIEMFELAYAEWDRIHGPELTWDQAVAGEWTTWMTMQLRRDPLIGSWAGLPMRSSPKNAPIWSMRPRTFRVRVWLPSCAGTSSRICLHPRRRMPPHCSPMPVDTVRCA